MKKILAAAALLLCAGAPAAKTDNVDLPFADDPAVLGAWYSVDFAARPEDFIPGKRATETDLFLERLEFLPGGKLKDTLSVWTKGFVLNRSAGTASAYTIKKIEGYDYLFFEWKSGDYTMRGMKPKYYVLARAGTKPKPALPAAQAGDGQERGYKCLNPVPGPGICRRPSPADYGRKRLPKLPAYDPEDSSGFPVDLRSYDLASLDLSGKQADLFYADFDSRTRFPSKMPPGYHPERIMALGRNPGLGVRALHAKGLTGKGVSIGILDQPLLTTHKEYAGSLKSYEEMFLPSQSSEASMHGGAVSSIAVGRTSGVAPDAELYYVGTMAWRDLPRLAQALDRLVALSEALPREKRLRVISISKGFSRREAGYADIMAAIRRAGAKGIMVLTTTTRDYCDFDISGLGREPLADPEKTSSYGPGLFWKKAFYASESSFPGELMVPMDSRTTASPTGNEEYVFYRNGGLSWAVPYVAGLYALACQAYPGITPELFFGAAMETAVPVEVPSKGAGRRLDKVVAPVKLLDRVAAMASSPN